MSEEEHKAARDVSRERIRQRLREEARLIKVRENEGEYMFDNPDLEHKTKRLTKQANLEEKYKDKPKIAFHQLDDEGNKLFMQAKRDQVLTTIGWSLIGNVAGVAVVQYIETKNTKWLALRHLQKREVMKAGAFISTVGLFTCYGYGCARQSFVRRKLELVEQYSVGSSEQ